MVSASVRQRGNESCTVIWGLIRTRFNGNRVPAGRFVPLWASQHLERYHGLASKREPTADAFAPNARTVYKYLHGFASTRCSMLCLACRGSTVRLNNLTVPRHYVTPLSIICHFLVKARGLEDECLNKCLNSSRKQQTFHKHLVFEACTPSQGSHRSASASLVFQL